MLHVLCKAVCTCCKEVLLLWEGIRGEAAAMCVEGRCYYAGSACCPVKCMPQGRRNAKAKAAA